MSQRYSIIMLSLLSLLLMTCQTTLAEAPRTFAGITLGQSDTGNVANCKEGIHKPVNNEVYNRISLNTIIREEDRYSDLIKVSPLKATHPQEVKGFEVPQDHQNYGYTANCYITDDIRLAKLGYYQNKLYYMEFIIPNDMIPGILQKVTGYAGCQQKKISKKTSFGVLEEYRTLGIDETVWMVQTNKPAFNEMKKMLVTSLIIYDEKIMMDVVNDINKTKSGKEDAIERERQRKREKAKDLIR
jgi:hypothetical protein